MWCTRLIATQTLDAAQQRPCVTRSQTTGAWAQRRDKASSKQHTSDPKRSAHSTTAESASDQRTATAPEPEPPNPTSAPAAASYFSRGRMVAISLYRGNLHLSGGAEGAEPRRWEPPRPVISAKRFRRLLRSRSLAVARLAGAPLPTLPDSPGEEAGDEEQQGQLQDEGEQQQQPEEGEVEQQQQVEDVEEQEEGAVEDADVNDAGEVVVEADGNGDAEEGQGESEGVDPNQEVSYPDGIEERKRKLNEKLDVLNKKKHDLVQMLKQVLNAEEEIRRRNMQASLRAAMPQPSENATDGSSVSWLAPRMTVDVNFGDIAVDSDAGSNQGTPGRPLHHFHSISPSTASFARSPFGSMQHHSGHTPRSPATFSTASPSRFAANGPQGQPPGLHSASLPGGYVASSPSPAASGGSSSVFRDSRPPNSM